MTEEEWEASASDGDLAKMDEAEVSREHDTKICLTDALAARQAVDTDSSRAPGLTSSLQGSVNLTAVLYCWCHSDSASVFLYFTLLLAVHYMGLTCETYKNCVECILGKTQKDCRRNSSK